jgi:hypothetical protein
VELLERLQLLSSSFVGGIWTITGTPGPDTITVDRNPKDLDMLRAFENGRLIGTRSASTVRGIRLRGLGGNDTLKIDESHGAIALGSVLSGGAGKNLLVGGSGPTVLDGGPGKVSDAPAAEGRRRPCCVAWRPTRRSFDRSVPSGNSSPRSARTWARARC